MSESFEWHILIGYNYLIQTRYKSFYLDSRQNEQHLCERLIGVSLAPGVDSSVSENV